MIDHKWVWNNYQVKSSPFLDHYDVSMDMCGARIIFYDVRAAGWLKFNVYWGEMGSNIHRWLKHFIKKHKFSPSPKTIHLTLLTEGRNYKNITRQLVSQNPFATPVIIYVAAQWSNMASQVLVNTDSGNGTKLLPKSAFTLSSMRFRGPLLHHFAMTCSVPTLLVSSVSPVFLLLKWKSNIINHNIWNLCNSDAIQNVYQNQIFIHNYIIYLYIACK